MTEIKALKKLSSLRWLALLQLNKLENFAGITGHSSLEFLWIEACRHLNNPHFLAGLNNLQTLRLLDCGEIAGIEVIRTLPQLRHIHAHGSIKVVAQDFSFLRDMQNLESVVLRGLPVNEAAYWKRRKRKYNLLRSDRA